MVLFRACCPCGEGLGLCPAWRPGVPRALLSSGVEGSAPPSSCSQKILLPCCTRAEQERFCVKSSLDFKRSLLNLPEKCPDFCTGLLVQRLFTGVVRYWRDPLLVQNCSVACNANPNQRDVNAAWKSHYPDLDCATVWAGF